ncbi:MAG: SGNH/GDSL hydrolase family protein [Microbacteriaceae bacterium]
MKRTIAAATILIAASLTAGCASPVMSPATEPATGPRVAFYGDSYTLGTGASSPAMRWSTKVSSARNWQEFNPSVNGLGFVNNRGNDRDLPGDIIANDPDIVFVTMGLNDNFSYASDPQRIHSQIDTDIDRLVAALPDARFIVVEPFWYTDERPESVGIIGGWVRDAAARVEADYIPGASHWIEGHPEWMAADGLHPNDEGYAAMTAQMETALDKLGLPQEQ